MINKNYWSSGEWNLICDSCGKKMKSSHAKHRWDGFIVCDKCFEHRHPQDFIKPKIDKITVPFTRPRPAEPFINITYIVPLSCIPSTSVGEANRGSADCARTGIRTMNDLID